MSTVAYFVLSAFTLQTAFSFPLTRVRLVKIKINKGYKSEIDFLEICTFCKFLSYVKFIVIFAVTYRVSFICNMGLHNIYTRNDIRIYTICMNKFAQINL